MFIPSVIENSKSDNPKSLNETGTVYFLVELFYILHSQIFIYILALINIEITIYATRYYNYYNYSMITPYSVKADQYDCMYPT